MLSAAKHLNAIQRNTPPNELAEHASLASLEFSQNQRQSAESNACQALDLFRRLGMRREQAEALLARLGV